VAQGPVAAAIGNAVADAVGVRVRDLPLTAEAVVAALERS
jgi:CO/xanthine dehydrogenase Mo-binding subunit